MMRLLGIAACCLFCAMLLKDKNRPLALLISVFGACLLLFSTVSQLKEIISRLNGLTASVTSFNAYFRLMLKVLGITVMTQLVADICRDNGEGALASMTELSAKIVVIALVLPLFEAVITIVGGLVQ